MKTLAILVLIFTAFSASTFKGKVIKVTDGDTIVVLNENK